MKGAARQARGNVGRMIRAFRAVNDLNLRQFANLIGLSAPTVMRIEQGRAMDAHTWLILQNWMLR